MDEDIKSVWFASFNPDYELMPLFLLEIKRTDIVDISKKEKGIVSELARELNNNTDELIKLIITEEIKILNRISNKSKF